MEIVVLCICFEYVCSIAAYNITVTVTRLDYQLQVSNHLLCRRVPQRHKRTLGHLLCAQVPMVLVSLVVAVGVLAALTGGGQEEDRVVL